MKIKLEKRYIQIGLTLFLTAISIMGVYFLVTKYKNITESVNSVFKILSPIIYGLFLAYIISPALNFVESKWIRPLFDRFKWYESREKKDRDAKIRHLSLALTLIIIFILFYMFFKAVIPETYKSITTIISSYSVYTTNLVNWVNRIMEENEDLAKTLSQLVVNASEETDNYLNDVVLPAVQSLLLPNLTDWLKNITSSIMNIVKFFWNILIGVIISIYVLNGKETVGKNAVKLTYAIFDNKFANKFVEAVRFVHRTFIGFLGGKIVDSLIIGIICYIGLLIIKMPYAALISLIIAVTNIIPFIGPFIGAVPSVILVLMIDPRKALVLAIFIVILQQIDGNIIGPKILSGSTGLNAFWILFSITLFGGLWGILGMIIGVPVTAVVLTGIKTVSDRRLEAKNLPVDIERYESVGEIDENGDIIKYIYVKPEKKPQDESTKILLSFLKKIGEWLKKGFIKFISFVKKLFSKKNKK